MNNYSIALEQMASMLDASKKPLEAFSRKTYQPSFEKFYQGCVAGFDAIEELYMSVGEPESMLDNMAGAFVDSAVEMIAAEKKKWQKDQMQMSLNMQLATFIYPAILNYKGESSKPLADRIGIKWKEAFPKSNVTAAEVEFIQNGFKRKFCYITTAVCETLGRADDCPELTLFRSYRDGYLMARPDGEELINKYYDLAPSIVKHIDERDDASVIYRSIWDDYLSGCAAYIEEGRNEECLELYKKMVDDLREEYFFLQ